MKKSSPSGSYRCTICRKIFPTSIQEDHHIIPRHLRATEETTELCSNCHTAVHKVANLCLKGSGSYTTLRELLRTLYKKRKTRLRCAKLARAIVEETLRTEDKPELRPSGAPVRLKIVMKPYERSLLKLAAQDAKTSLTGLVRTVLLGCIEKWKQGQGASRNRPTKL